MVHTLILINFFFAFLATRYFIQLKSNNLKEKDKCIFKYEMLIKFYLWTIVILKIILITYYIKFFKFYQNLYKYLLTFQ